MHSICESNPKPAVFTVPGGSLSGPVIQYLARTGKAVTAANGGMIGYDPGSISSINPGNWYGTGGYDLSIMDKGTARSRRRVDVL
jgi:hypothetical protein